MLIETDPRAIAEFITRKTAQGHSAMSVMPGVSMISSGERGSSISISRDGGEMVIIGQLPHVATITTGSPRNPVRRDMPNDRKPIEKRAVDLTERELAEILTAWRAGRSALDLEFVDAVFKDGRWHSKS